MKILPDFLLLGGAPSLEDLLLFLVLPAIIFLLNLIVGIIHFNKGANASGTLRTTDGIVAGLSVIFAVFSFINSKGDAFLLLIGVVQLLPAILTLIAFKRK